MTGGAFPRAVLDHLVVAAATLADGIDHMAFSATGLRAMIATLDAKSVSYQCRQQKGSGVWQIFLHDPNGARVELDFAPDEPAPG